DKSLDFSKSKSQLNLKTVSGETLQENGRTISPLLKTQRSIDLKYIKVEASKSKNLLSTSYKLNIKSK
ncbi:MAG: hypothetical protein QXO96_06445, partial [Sulfolobales archaeon]